MRKILFTITVILLVAAFGVSAFLLGNYVIEGKREAEANQKLADMVAQTPTQTTAPAASSEAPATEVTDAPTEVPEPTMIPNYLEVHAQNPDTVGWLRIDGTKLNYPVMQTPDSPDYYLKRNFEKKDSDWGAIYAREQCDINKPSDNITIYGHHMKDGSMFAALSAYTSKSTWEKNSLIFFDTLYEAHTYEIFAVFKTSANIGEGFSYHQFVDAENEQEFNDFVAKCKELSFYDTGLTPKYGDKLICLSTCEYSLDNGRLVVAAYRID